MYAIIKTGGKQYKVTEGQEIFIEKLTAEENETVEIPVVAVGNEDGTLDFAEGKTVSAKVLKNGKAKKITVFTYKPKKGSSHKKQGHRQPYTMVKIESLGGAAPKKSAPKKAESKKVLEDGFTKYPESQSILIGLINYYLENNEDPEKLFELIDHAKKNEPNNASLYYVEGNIYKQLGKREEALKAYYSCSEINPDYEFGYIGAGILYYELALEYQDKAQNEFDDKKYMELVSEFEKALENAYEPFEKAFNVSKDDSIKINIAEYLKNICYRFREKDQKYEAGFEKYSTIVKEGRIN